MSCELQKGKESFIGIVLCQCFPIKNNRIESAINSGMLDYSCSFHYLKQKRMSHQNMLARYLLDKNKGHPKNRIDCNQDASVPIFRHKREEPARQTYIHHINHRQNKYLLQSEQNSDSSIEIDGQKSCSWNQLFQQVKYNKNRTNESLMKILLKDFLEKKLSSLKPSRTEQNSASDRGEGSKDTIDAKKKPFYKKEQTQPQSKRNYRCNGNTTKITIMRIADLQKVINRQKIRKNTSPHLSVKTNSDQTIIKTPPEIDSHLYDCTKNGNQKQQLQESILIKRKLPDITPVNKQELLKVQQRHKFKPQLLQKRQEIRNNNIEHQYLKKRMLKVHQHSNDTDTSISLRRKNKLSQIMHTTLEKASQKEEINVDPWSTSEIKPEQKMELFGE